MKKFIFQSTLLIFIFILSSCIFPQSDTKKEKDYLKTNVDSLVEIKKIDSTNNCGYFLYQNYPNPFCPVLDCRFSVGEFSKVKIELINDTLHKILIYLDRYLEKGKYSFYLVSDKYFNWDSGKYILRMEATSEGKSTKFISRKVFIYIK